MIDYEKLKETAAHEIHKTYLRTCKELGWEVKEENKVPYSKLSEDAKRLDIASFESALATLKAFGLINEVKLKELNQPEPMIDYNKLKIAHELAEKYSLLGDDVINVTVHFMNGQHSYWLSGSSVDDEYDDVDDLILELKELTKTEPKYEEGSRVYWMYNNKIYTGLTDAFFNTEGGYRYQINSNGKPYNLHEEQLYPSRAELIDAQIDYWRNLRGDITSEEVIND